MYLRGRRIKHFFELWFRRIYHFSFQKSGISCPQQPPTEKVLKFNVIFCDSTQKFFFSKHPNKAKFNDMDDSAVLSSHFSGIITSAASMTSTASITSMASFHQKIYWSWWLVHSWYQNDQFWSLFVEWIIENPIFY